MRRREFLHYTAALTVLAHASRVCAAAHRPEIAFTFDDPTTKDGANLTYPEINGRILAALANHKIKAALFVCGMRIDSGPGHQLVSDWDTHGHLIGNHSYSHLNFDEVTLSEFEADLVKNEPLIRSYRQFQPRFRYPYFKEGDTVRKRDGMRSFLVGRGYRHGRATIDASDWAISARLQKRVAENPQADLAGYRDFYLQHMWERAQYYQSLAKRLLTQPVRHTVLLHHNALNALFLSDLIAMFVAKGWVAVNAEYAYEDPVYERQPNIVPAGESLIWALAKESGKFTSQLRYPGEDDTYENPKMDALKL
ncbi:MAG TPA: polysaccharide deacetylase family protein [Steroidobacteraceae bacterium]